MAASLIYAQQATIPAGTSQGSPVVVNVSFPDAAVSQITVTVPPGNLGLSGFQLWVKGGQVIPANQGGWIVADDRVITWNLIDLPDTGAWQVVGYNGDIYDHSILVEFSAEPVGVTAAATDAGASDAATADVLALGAG
jgi:hypothetical protein